MLQWHWIAHPSDLQTWWQRAPAWIALDTEFVRERTYWPQLALVQMAIADAVLIIDCHAEGMNAALRPWLTAPHLLKIMHSASEDCVALHHCCGSVPSPLFDTQLAATLTGMGHMLSYQKLVADVTGVQLAKEETRSDWQQRPLSHAQLCYAADDVRYLGPLYRSLHAQLAQQQRIAWLKEDCERLIAHACQEDSERLLQINHRFGRGLDQAERHRLNRILAWRESYARAADVPRNWVIDSALAQQLAQHPPENRDALQQALAASPKAARARKLVAPLWQAFNTPCANETPSVDAIIDTVESTRLVKRLQHIVTQQSQASGIPAAYLASRRHLETFILQRVWPTALGQWRRQLLEQPLLQALRAHEATVKKDQPQPR